MNLLEKLILEFHAANGYEARMSQSYGDVKIRRHGDESCTQHWLSDYRIDHVDGKPVLQLCSPPFDIQFRAKVAALITEYGYDAVLCEVGEYAP